MGARRRLVLVRPSRRGMQLPTAATPLRDDTPTAAMPLAGDRPSTAARSDGGRQALGGGGSGAVLTEGGASTNARATPACDEESLGDASSATRTTTDAQWPDAAQRAGGHAVSQSAPW